jgi:hypothetical protein
MDLLLHLLPHGSPFHVEAWQLDEATAQLTFRISSTQSLVHCPVCRFPTRRIHSHYRRTLADLPWAHLRVVLQLPGFRANNARVYGSPKARQTPAGVELPGAAKGRSRR